MAGMTAIINIHQAKTELSKLLVRVDAGEEIVIARAGKPVARLVPIKSARNPRVLSHAAGTVRISSDFDASLADDFLEAFSGASE